MKNQMDGPTANRYELLLDDDVGDLLETLVKEKVKHQKKKNTVTTSTHNNKLISSGSIISVEGGGNTNKKSNENVSSAKNVAEEKIIKSSAMNKNYDKKLQGGDFAGGQKRKDFSDNVNNLGLNLNGSSGGKSNEQFSYRNSQQDELQPRQPFGVNGYFEAAAGETREQRNRDDITRPEGTQQPQLQNLHYQSQNVQQNGNFGPADYQNNDRPQKRDEQPRRNFNGKREFDRQSRYDKTGVKAVDKCAHNWGSQQNYQSQNIQQNANLGPVDYQNKDRSQRRDEPPRRDFNSNRGGKREFDRQSRYDKTRVVDKGAGAHNCGLQQQNYQSQNIQQNGNLGTADYQNKDRSQRRDEPPRRNFSGKREFDRHSGSDKTGVKAVDKREGAGAHNWGSHKQDIEDLNKTNVEVLGKDDSAGEQQTEQATTKELTLDEWKAQREVRAKPQYNIRKAGEGEDLSQWKKMIALNNKKLNEESEEEFEYSPSMYPQRVGRLQRVLDIEFNFKDARRVRGRGGRQGAAPGRRECDGGGDRADDENGTGDDGGGKRASRNPVHAKSHESGGGERQHAPKVDDQHDFPSLG